MMTKAKKAPTRKASSRKPRRAPSPTMKEVQASWQEGYRPFVEDCRESFGFLVHDLGFALAEVTVTPPECAVSFARDRASVQIQSEYCGPPWVVVKVGDPPKAYGLHEFMKQLQPEYEAREPVAPSLPDEVQRRALLDHHAAFLREHADRILGADPALLARLDARRVQAQE
jgi:hypothetical protein